MTSGTSEFKGKRVLVTGATGFLGGAAARDLRARGAEVRAQGRNPELLRKLAADGLVPAPGDLLDRAAVAKMVADVDVVVHCAALSSPWGTYEAFYRANVEATEILADAALAARGGRPVERFIHISTPSIYTARFHRRNLREDAPLPPKKISGYGETKWLSEVALDRRIERGLWAIKLRPLNIIGPGDTTVLPRLLRLADRKMIPVLPEGDAETDLTPIENVLAVIRSAFTAPDGVRGRAYNISNGEPITIPEILRIIHAVRGVEARPRKLRPRIALGFAGAVEWFYRNFRGGAEPAVTVQALCALLYSRSLNVEAARRDLGFRPLGGTEAYLRARLSE
ncbi:MAG: NAD-dependent epimerase/dehydratase family protein [Bdellovibrionales bacterium]|nr:NAD-dependent epimerase/dehydratase family protein [Bdellovibrionales bacterium]